MSKKSKKKKTEKKIDIGDEIDKLDLEVSRMRSRMYKALLKQSEKSDTSYIR